MRIVVLCIHHLLLMLREGIKPCRLGRHRRPSCWDWGKIPERQILLRDISEVRSQPISRGAEVEVAGEVGEAGVQVSRHQLAVSRGGGHQGTDTSWTWTVPSIPHGKYLSTHCCSYSVRRHYQSYYQIQRDWKMTEKKLPQNLKWWSCCQVGTGLDTSCTCRSHKCKWSFAAHWSQPVPCQVWGQCSNHCTQSSVLV